MALEIHIVRRRYEAMGHKVRIVHAEQLEVIPSDGKPSFRVDKNGHEYHGEQCESHRQDEINNLVAHGHYKREELK